MNQHRWRWQSRVKEVFVEIFCFKGSGKCWVSYTINRSAKFLQTFCRTIFQHELRSFKGFILFDIITPFLKSILKKSSEIYEYIYRWSLQWCVLWQIFSTTSKNREIIKLLVEPYYRILHNYSKHCFQKIMCN